MSNPWRHIPEVQRLAQWWEIDIETATRDDIDRAEREADTAFPLDASDRQSFETLRIAVQD